MREEEWTADHAADPYGLEQPMIAVRDVEARRAVPRTDQEWMESFLLPHNHSLRVVC